LVFDARQIPTRRAGARNTFKEPAGGMVGYSKRERIETTPTRGEDDPL
jgi:hypothetical protein